VLLRRSDWWLLSNDQIIRRARRSTRSGSRRLFGHTVIRPDRTVDDEVDRASRTEPDAWKCYTSGSPVAVTKGTAWRLDDEGLVYPWYEKAMKSGSGHLYHKGLLPLDTNVLAGVWNSHPDDVLRPRRMAAAQLQSLHGRCATSRGPGIFARQVRKDRPHRLDTDCANLLEARLQERLRRTCTTFATVAVASRVWRPR